MSLYEIPVTTIAGKPTTLAEYKGRVLMIVNVASRCSFTGQYAGLETLYQKYKDRGFVVLGFPCNQFLYQEPGDEAAIQQFCSTKYNVTFPMFAKVDVNGSSTHPLYQHLKNEARGFLWTKRIMWNFTKFLVSRDGNSVKRYAFAVPPVTLGNAVEKMLGKPVN